VRTYVLTAASLSLISFLLEALPQAGTFHMSLASSFGRGQTLHGLAECSFCVLKQPLALHLITASTILSQTSSHALFLLNKRERWPSFFQTWNPVQLCSSFLFRMETLRCGFRESQKLTLFARIRDLLERTHSYAEPRNPFGK
jgi:hypothetical protein